MTVKKVICVLLLFSLVAFCMPVSAYTAEEIAINQAIWLNEHGYQVSGTYEEIEKIYREVRYGVKDTDDDDEYEPHIVPYPVPTPEPEERMF